MMLSSGFARCALTAVLAARAAAHVSSLAALARVAALLGAFSAPFLPASMTIMPTLVDSAGLTAAYTGSGVSDKGNAGDKEKLSANKGLPGAGA